VGEVGWAGIDIPVHHVIELMAAAPGDWGDATITTTWAVTGSNA